MSLSSFFHHIIEFFKSDKAKHAFGEVSKIVPIALVIVKRIAELTPNRTDDEIVAAFEHYGIPTIDRGKLDPGAALLELATKVVADRLPPGTAKNLIQTAIQIAVTGSKAETLAG